MCFKDFFVKKPQVEQNDVYSPSRDGGQKSREHQEVTSTISKLATQVKYAIETQENKADEVKLMVRVDGNWKIQGGKKLFKWIFMLQKNQEIILC